MVKTWRSALSAFNRSAQRWDHIPHATQKLSLVSWNLNYLSQWPLTRTKLILNHILEAPKFPDIIFLQEATCETWPTILSDERVRASFLVTDAKEEGQLTFRREFTTMTLLNRATFTNSSRKLQRDVNGTEGVEKFRLGSSQRVLLPCDDDRDALCLDIIPPLSPGTMYRLINVHLDQNDCTIYRSMQLKLLADLIREPGCSGGLIAGDYSANTEEDEWLIYENHMVDVWHDLYGRDDPSGATFRVGFENPSRFDKVATLGVNADKLEVLRPGFVAVTRMGDFPLEIPWSNHCGLRCTFTI